MATFKPGETLKTEEAVIEVTVSPDEPLPVGLHIFQLVVVDDPGRLRLVARVEPARVEVNIRDTQRPTAVITAKPAQPELGQSFVLSGERSSDIAPGRITTYLWTLLEAPQ